MRYNLNLPQRGIIEAGLKGLPLVLALFLDYLGGFFRSPGIKHINFGEHEFAWLDLHTAACDLPCLVPTTLSREAQVQKVSRWLACLRKLGLIETRRMNGRLYFRLTPLALEMLGGLPSCRNSQDPLVENRKKESSITIINEHTNKEMITQRTKEASLSQEDNEDFPKFWSAYPKKVAKLDAQKAWNQTRSVRPTILILLKAIRAASLSDAWCEHNGKFPIQPPGCANKGGWIR